MFGTTGDDTARIAGNLGFTSDIGVIATEFSLGYAMDFFGRKTITVVGLFITALAVTFMPIVNLPGLYILRIFSSVGVIPALYTPYTLDYVQKGSLGLVTGYYTVLSQIASTISTTCAIQA